MALAKVIKRGNHLGVIIPKEEAKKQKLRAGDNVYLEMRKI